ncbi:MAG: GNAT family N-acetyltransferase [Spirochaetaceae bacterium]|jgi:GNAT superfamily N-acetyltransferase|nr:GNAT family N-acetyltransferase [Spirochaetaceae bacterium]
MNMWKKLSSRTVPAAEAFLQEQEPYCAGASFRFITRTNQDHIWIAGKTRPWGILIYTRRILYPVFRRQDREGPAPAENPSPGSGAAGHGPQKDTGLPRFFSFLLDRRPLHAMQGLAANMDLLEPVLERKGLAAPEKYDYELRILNRQGPGGKAPGVGTFYSPPRGLVIRRPLPPDMEGIFPLQRGYEQEEVLPKRAVFNAAACRKSLEQMISAEMILIAELGGTPVGKININARAFTCLQIGGVYVLPQFRNRGIAQALTAEIIRRLEPLKKKFTLFVKKTNGPARRVYDNTGFVKIADYRINYY